MTHIGDLNILLGSLPFRLDEIQESPIGIVEVEIVPRFSLLGPIRNVVRFHLRDGIDHEADGDL